MNEKRVYLEQSYKDNWQNFLDSLYHRSTASSWDVCIITASNEDQARAYRLQIEHRLQANLLPDNTRYLVLPDPDGKRVGSGGATLNALLRSYLMLKDEKEGNYFENNRILIIHSGGDSKRIPQYSAFGKLFSRVPRELPDGRPSTLFDEFLISLSGIPSRMKEGVLVVSGDVLLLFDNNQLDFGRQGVVGVTSKVAAKVGSNHGVYVENSANGKVKKFLHKASVSKLIENQAVDESGNVNLDTGIVWFDASVANVLLNLVYDDNKHVMQNRVAEFINEEVRLNFYGDFLFPLTEDATLDQYLMEKGESDHPSKLIEIRKVLWDKLNNIPLYVQTISPSEFIHFGTSIEFSDLLTTKVSNYNGIEWQKCILGYSETKCNATLVNTCIAKGIDNTNGRILIEDSYLLAEGIIGDGSVISNVISAKQIRLLDNIVLHQLPIAEVDDDINYVTRIYGILDNPKDDISSGTYCNIPWMSWLGLSEDISAQDIWYDVPNDKRTLWNAKLFPVCANRDESLELTFWLQNPINADRKTVRRWLIAKRVSFEDCISLTDRIQILKEQALIEEVVRVKTFLRFIKEEKEFEVCAKILGSDPKFIVKLLPKVLKEIEKCDEPLIRMRGYRVVAEIVRLLPSNFILEDDQVAITLESIPDHLRAEGTWSLLEDKAFSDLSNSIQFYQTSTPASNNVNDFKYQYVKVNAAARADFAGGWSDTPPFSIEKGGTVLNCSIDLFGKLPIEVTARVINEPKLILCSDDLNVKKDVLTTDYVLDYADPSDPLALHKTALIITGLIPRIPNCSITNIFNAKNMGVELTTKVNIPKGSGLGTSSILAGAMIKCIHALLGNNLSNYQLFDQVLIMEQMLTTGGGWQDQVGGLTGGIKLIRSKPGLPQLPKCFRVNLSATAKEKLDEQFIIVYTGQRRLAKRILRDIMGAYILRDKNVVSSLYCIQDIAVSMRDALIQGDLELVGQLMTRHWRINKSMDPGSTNAFIDLIFNVCRPYIYGGKLCGAGGGGFMELIAKDKESVGRLNNVLQEEFPSSNVRIWPSRIVDKSLIIETTPF